MESLLVPSAYKFGVLYCKDGQTAENDMFCNDSPSPEFYEFLEFIGDKVQLKGWTSYKGGLDVHSDTTGTHSIFTQYEGISVMFHVAPMLPTNPKDPQQVEKKRHIGNDVVVIIFKDGDSEPFDPCCITSEFNHIFLVITQDKNRKTGTWYRIGVTTRDGLSPIEPQLPGIPIFEKNEIFRHLLLTKMINCERAAMHSAAFKERMERVKEQQLKSVLQNALKTKK